MKPPLIVIAGPTASGKTKVSIELAKKINGEIISADSMQIYKYMDIGTAKPSEEEMEGIKHYLVDELFPDEDYCVAVFQKMAKKYLNEIYNKGKIPIIVGGTGFYINALIYDNNFEAVENDYDYRVKLYALAEEKGNEYVHDMLKCVDPQAWKKIHFNNIKRIVRALEYNKITNKKISDHNDYEKARECPYNLNFAVLELERESLYERINLRIDKMLNLGLVNEVENLLFKGYTEGLTSMKGLGYKEIIPYIKGECTLEAAVDVLKRNTRHFAKRQLTWFKNQTDGVWLNVDEIIPWFTTVLN